MSKNYPERRSIRLRGYDYSQDGLYFITICTYNREPIFGRIANGKMQLNDAGIIARDAWLDTARIRPNVVLGDFVVMPNHFHAVFAIDNTVFGRGDLPVAYDYNIFDRDIATTENSMGGSMDGSMGGSMDGSMGDQRVAPTGPKPNSVGAIIAGFKSTVTVRINQSRNSPGQRVWQRNYHEHIIRNEHSLHRISQYIVSNPDRWQDDCFFDK